MKKVCVMLGEPTIDVPVQGKDASGKTAKITAVFKRYNAEQTQELLDKVLPLAGNISVPGNLDKALAILKSEIVALKSVSLFDPETLEKVVDIEDTRKLTLPKVSTENKDDETAPWERGPAAGLAFLLDLYLSTPAWGAAFIEAFFAVHNNNVNYVEGLTGNF